MQNEKSTYTSVAEASRFTYDEESDELYLTFRVTDPDLKRRIKNDFARDEIFELIGKKLMKKEY